MTKAQATRIIQNFCSRLHIVDSGKQHDFALHLGRKYVGGITLYYDIPLNSLFNENGTILVQGRKPLAKKLVKAVWEALDRDHFYDRCFQLARDLKVPEEDMRFILADFLNKPADFGLSRLQVDLWKAVEEQRHLGLHAQSKQFIYV